MTYIVSTNYLFNQILRLQNIRYLADRSIANISIQPKNIKPYKYSNKKKTLLQKK